MRSKVFLSCNLFVLSCRKYYCMFQSLMLVAFYFAALLNKKKLSIKEKRKLLTILAGPPNKKELKGWFQDRRNMPYFWSITGLPWASLNNQRTKICPVTKLKQEPNYLKSEEMTTLIQSYKLVRNFCQVQIHKLLINLNKMNKWFLFS